MISNNLMHFITRHGRYGDKLHLLDLVESNLCILSHAVATPEYIVLEFKKNRRPQ